MFEKNILISNCQISNLFFQNLKKKQKEVVWDYGKIAENLKYNTVGLNIYFICIIDL